MDGGLLQLLTIRQHVTQVETMPVPTHTSGTCTLSPPDNQQDLAPQQKHQQGLNLPFPLGRVPEDVGLIVLSFLPAKELASMRRLNPEFLRTTDRHADALWGSLNLCDHPSMVSPLTRAGAQDNNSLSPHQEYIKNIMRRANDEVGNLRANHRLRESLDSYTWPIRWPRRTAPRTSSIYSAISSTIGNSIARRDGGGGGVIGLLCDLVTIPDPRIARALSHKRRAALSTVVVDSDRVIFDFRRRGLHSGPVNFLPMSTLRLENPTPLAPLLVPLLLPPPPRNTAAISAAPGAVPGTAEDGGRLEEQALERKGTPDLLPRARQTPAPDGFLGYAVRLLQLRPEHEPLRWTVLFALFKDLVVFETTEQAEAVRARVPGQQLFYCALDHPGAQDEPCPSGGRPLPHISHWGFQRGLASSGGSGGGGLYHGGGEVPGETGRVGETVGDAVEKQERIACFAKSSLAFLQYGGGVGRRLLA